MFETGRRSAISSSELGLYSDRSDYYNRSKYGPVVKKFVIGMMAVVAVILAAIFIYDFASGAVASSKVSQETKHVYILQNALKKPAYYAKKSSTTTTAAYPEMGKLTSAEIQERSDTDGNYTYVDLSADDDDNFDSMDLNTAETKNLNLTNFRISSRSLKLKKDELKKDKVEGKEMFRNHALVYRVRQMFKHSDTEELNKQPLKPKPFNFELKNPEIKKIKYPQLSQYRYPHQSRNIQDILKYLIDDPATTKHGIKFSGVYTSPKKSDFYSDISDMFTDDRSELSGETDELLDSEAEEDEEEEENTSHFSITHHDPFYQYKPKHPADVNLLAPANVRYTPTSINRYNPFIEHPYHRPLVLPISRPVIPPVITTELPIYDNAGAYTGGYGKKKKPKPFSVMLDIYPITDLNDQVSNKVTSRPRPASMSIPIPISLPVPDESIHDTKYHRPPHHLDFRKPMIPMYKRGIRFIQTPIPIVAMPANQLTGSEDDEKKQMIFHLNLYPRRKTKLNRHDILQRTGKMPSDERKKFMQKVMSPLELLAKHMTDQSAIENSKIDATDGTPQAMSLTRYQESFLEMPNEEETEFITNETSQDEIPDNHRKIEIEDLLVPETTEKMSVTEIITETTDNTAETTEKIIDTTQNNIGTTHKPRNCDVKNNMIDTTTVSTTTIDIDTIEGFQKFASGLVSAT